MRAYLIYKKGAVTFRFKRSVLIFKIHLENLYEELDLGVYAFVPNTAAA